MTHRCWWPGRSARPALRWGLCLLAGAAALLSAGAPAFPQSPGNPALPPLVANGSAHFVDGAIRLTDAPWQRGSVFTATPVDISSFRATFTCRMAPVPGWALPPGDGLTFTLQGNGPTALGDYGGYLGYAGIGRSLAIKLDTWQNVWDPSWSTTGLFVNGEVPFGGDALPDGIGLSVGHPIQVAIGYDGVSRLAVTIGDAATGQVWSRTYGGINLPALVGGPTAYAGFTSGTGISCAFHDVLAWQIGDEVNHSPVAEAGPDQVVEMAGPAGAAVTLDGAESTDPDGDALTYAWDLDGNGTPDATGPTCRASYGRGAHVATLMVADEHGASSTDTVSIRVVDTTAPAIRSITASPALLWPPGGQMVDVALTVNAVDAGDAAPVSRVVGVTCSEPPEAGDWQLTGHLALRLRAQRTGQGDGRTYTITVECRDASGNKTAATVPVRVVHDRGGK